MYLNLELLGKAILKISLTTLQKMLLVLEQLLILGMKILLFG